MVPEQLEAMIQFGNTWPCTLVPSYSDKPTLKL
jgi:hypothetical protein